MFLGLDLGTSGLKGLVIDDTGAVLAEATAPLTVSRPAPGFSEQNPADWITAAETVLRTLSRKLDMGAISGIGLSGQMHGATVLDKSDNVLRPCILWNDTRASAQAAQLDANPQFRAISGNIVFPGFTAPKLVWMAQQEPDLFAQIGKVLLPKDYLRLWLTGAHVAEMSDAAGTSWLDVGARDWSDDLLAATGLNRAHMPALVEGSAQSGGVRAAVAQEFGLRAGIPVAGGAGDNAATAIGLGIAQGGQGFVSLGTSGVLFAATDGYAPAPETAVHTFCHALPHTWHQMGVILAASDALNWFAGIAGATAAELTTNLGSLQAPGRTLFLPYLGGERTPLNDAHIRGAFIGLEHATDRAAATRAVMEGVVYALVDCQQALAATGTQLHTVLAAGGGARSEYWLSALATALDLPIHVPQAGDYGAALGAARLAIMAATGAGTDAMPLPPIARSFDPVSHTTQAFQDGYARYRKAQTALKELT
ncbi:MAG: xylulokinase [Roseinatronobacter sp.]|nr:xylulokinase [Roseinatronobacter sp.]